MVTGQFCSTADVSEHCPKTLW